MLRRLDPVVRIAFVAHDSHLNKWPVETYHPTADCWLLSSLVMVVNMNVEGFIFSSHLPSRWVSTRFVWFLFMEHTHPKTIHRIIIGEEKQCIIRAFDFVISALVPGRPHQRQGSKRSYCHRPLFRRFGSGGGAPKEEWAPPATHYCWPGCQTVVWCRSVFRLSKMKALASLFSSSLNWMQTVQM